MRKYSKHNEGYNWIIAMIDIFSRYAFTIAVKSKSGKDVLSGFEDLSRNFMKDLESIRKRSRRTRVRNFLILISKSI